MWSQMVDLTLGIVGQVPHGPAAMCHSTLGDDAIGVFNSDFGGHPLTLTD